MDNAALLEGFRAKAAEFRRMADEIDQHIDALTKLLGSGPSAETAPSGASTRKAVRSKGSKGKAPGTISMRWRDHFVALYDSVGRDSFEVDVVQQRLRHTEGRDPKPSEVHRLFKNHVKHGYLVQPSRDSYQMTAKLIDLIGLQTESPSAATEGQSDGDVAERSIAADSKSDGADPTKEAPVGSNPTVSAPVIRDQVPFEEKLGLSTNPRPNS